MANRIIEEKSAVSSSASGVAANSTVVNSGEFVTLSGGFVTKASTSAIIEGYSAETTTYAADNQTVAKARLQYVKADPKVVVRVAISGGTITAADEGKYFILGANGYTVDGTSESTLVGSLRMVKFISATLADFAIVNKFATV